MVINPWSHLSRFIESPFFAESTDTHICLHLPLINLSFYLLEMFPFYSHSLQVLPCFPLLTDDFISCFTDVFSLSFEQLQALLFLPWCILLPPPDPPSPLNLSLTPQLVLFILAPFLVLCPSDSSFLLESSISPSLCLSFPHSSTSPKI